MASIWQSPKGLRKQGTNVAWIGLAVAVASQLAPKFDWLKWVGIGLTAIGLVLRSQTDRLDEPRRLTAAQRKAILDYLKTARKCPISVSYLGSDPEAKKFASVIKGLLEEAGFAVTKFE